MTTPPCARFLLPGSVEDAVGPDSRGAWLRGQLAVVGAAEAVDRSIGSPASWLDCRTPRP